MIFTTQLETVEKIFTLQKMVACTRLVQSRSINVENSDPCL